MDKNMRYCNSCKSDNNWNYCCKMGVKNYIIELEKQLEMTQYNNEQYNNQIIMLRSRTQIAELSLKYENLKSMIIGIIATYISMVLLSIFNF